MADLLWSVMRRRSDRTWTVPDLISAVGVISPRYARTYVLRLHQTGYLACAESADRTDGNRFSPARWRLVRNTGPAAPILCGAGGANGVYDLNKRVHYPIVLHEEDDAAGA
jgi:hypothetical protein